MNFWFPVVVILAGIVAYLCVTPGPRIFEQDIILNQQAMRCFQFVTNFSRYPSWLDSVKAVTSDVDPSSALVGTEFELLFSKNYVGKALYFSEFESEHFQMTSYSTIKKLELAREFCLCLTFRR